MDTVEKTDERQITLRCSSGNGTAEIGRPRLRTGATGPSKGVSTGRVGHQRVSTGANRCLNEFLENVIVYPEAVSIAFCRIPQADDRRERDI